MRRWGDVLFEAAASVAARPGRTLLTALGAMLGVGSLVAIIGFATTTGAQIASRFDDAAPTEVVVAESVRPGASPIMTWDDTEDLRLLGGVTATAARVDLGAEHRLRTVEAFDPLAPPDPETRLQGVTPSMALVGEFEFTQGGMFDEGHSRRADHVAVLGAAAAARLGIEDITRQSVLLIDDVPYVITGIFDAAPTEADLGSSVLVPDGTARARFDAPHPGALHVRTQPGTTQTVAEQAPLALAPSSPRRMTVSYTPAPDLVRQQVDADLQTMFVVLGAVSLLGGAIGIMNTMLISVLERRSEIGLRRAVGARRREVVVQFVAEAAGVGLIGGILGASVGTLVVVAFAVAQGWTPAASWWVPLLGIGVGGITGVAAGAFPAWRASRIEPAAALRLG